MPMQSGSQRQGGSFMNDIRGCANAMSFAAGVFATVGEVAIFRSGFGERYFNSWKVVAGIPVILLFNVFRGLHSPAPMSLFLVWYVLMCLIHRTYIIRRRQRRVRGEGGLPVHSQYNGRSRLSAWFAKKSEESIKGEVEPACMLVLGVVTLFVAPSLGCLFMCCAIGMAINTQMIVRFDQERAQDLADAAIEAEAIAMHAREMRGEVVHIHRR